VRADLAVYLLDTVRDVAALSRWPETSASFFGRQGGRGSERVLVGYRDDYSVWPVGSVQRAGQALITDLSSWPLSFASAHVVDDGQRHDGSVDDRGDRSMDEAMEPSAALRKGALCDRDESTVAFVRAMFGRLGEKWPIRALDCLADGPARFTALMGAMPGVSHRMLTVTLRGTCERWDDQPDGVCGNPSTRRVRAHPNGRQLPHPPAPVGGLDPRSPRRDREQPQGNGRRSAILTCECVTH
jgi:hypothetical protein